MIDDIFNCYFKIDKLNKKREKFSNDVSNIKIYRYNLKEILKEDTKIRNRVVFAFEVKIFSLLQMYYIKQDAWFGGDKLAGVNCRRFMDQNEVIINIIRDICIEMNKCTVSEDKMNMYCDKYKQTFNKIYHAYHFMRTEKITDELISKQNIMYIKKLL